MSGLDLELSAVLLDADPEEIVMEYQVESERGFHMLGSRVFTSNTLLPMDPTHFSSINGEPLGNALINYEVPDDAWVWAWSRWYVDMTADVDDQGWCYAWRFRSKQWSGRHRFMRSFVRQRLWKRPRIKRSVLQNGVASGVKRPAEEAEEDPECDEHVVELRQAVTEEDARDKAQRMMDQVRSLRNDREKIEWIFEYVSERREDIHWLVEIREQLLALLQFPISKRHLMQKLSESPNKNCELFVLARSTAWRDQVLRRGEPESEATTEEAASSMEP